MDIGFEATGGEVSIEYLVGQSGKHMFGVLGGVRYIKQEYSADLTVNDVPTFSGSVDDSWTDLLVGVTWLFAKSFMARFSAGVTVAEFEEGNIGDSDWFFYDAEEYSFGANVLYMF